MAKSYLIDIDLNKNLLKNFKIEGFSIPPSTPYETQIINYTGANIGDSLGAGLYIYINGSWERLNLKDTQIRSLLSPKISGNILDVNGNNILSLSATTSAVNNISLSNAITGGSPSFNAVGADANISINLVPKGSGNLTVNGAPVVTQANTLSLSNKTLVNPRINTQLLDVNGNIILNLPSTTSAVNYLTINNSILGGDLSLVATGSDANISINLVPKGTGILKSNNIEIVTLSSTQLLTNKTLTTPRIGTSILDVNGNNILTLSATTNAVNGFNISNSILGNSPLLSVVGYDANINFVISSKGTGQIILSNDTIINSTGYLKIPNGTTIQQPVGSNGMLRFNSTTLKFEFFENGSWVNYLPGSSSGYVTSVNGFDGVVVLTTTDISEGTNLYYTQGRFDTAFSAKSTTNLAEGTNLYYTDSRVDTRVNSFKGVINGIASLDSGGKVPTTQLPDSVLGTLQYQGSWNASLNTPTLTSSVGTKGYYYVVSVAGTTNLNGITDWQIGDWAVYNGSIWEKIDNTSTVTSVNGTTGAVVLTTTNISEGTNLYYTQGRFDTAFTAKSTTNLAEGTNLYYTTTRVLSTSLTGLDLTLTGAISATDTILQAFGRIQNRVSSLTSNLTTKGDLWTYSTTNTRLAVGIDGEFLMADSTQNTGLRWGSVLNTTLNGLTISNSIVTSADSIIQAFGKLQGQVSNKIESSSPIIQQNPYVNVRTTLNATVLNTDLTLTGFDFSTFPTSGYVCLNNGILMELVYYSSRTSTVLTIPTGKRGLFGTTAQTINPVTGWAFTIPSFIIAKDETTRPVFFNTVAGGASGSTIDSRFLLNANSFPQGTEIVRISSSGNTSVRIDAQAGTSTLYISKSSATSYGVLEFQTGTTRNYIVYNDNTNTFRIERSTGSNEFILNSSGLLGFGTAPVSGIKHIFDSNATTNVTIRIKAVASQSADLLQLTDNNSTLLSYFSSTGNLAIGGAFTVTTVVNPKLHIKQTSTTNQGIYIDSVDTTDGNYAPLVIKGGLVTGGARYFQVFRDLNNAPRVLYGISNDNNVDSILNIPGTGTAKFKWVHSGDLTNTLACLDMNGNWSMGGNFAAASKLHIKTYIATNIGMIVEGIASQSGDLLQLKDSTTVLSKFDAAGVLTVPRLNTTTFYMGLGQLAWTPTVARTLTLPDTTGTIALTSDIITYTSGSGINITSNVVSLNLSAYNTANNIGIKVSQAGTTADSLALRVHETGNDTISRFWMDGFIMRFDFEGARGLQGSYPTYLNIDGDSDNITLGGYVSILKDLSVDGKTLNLASDLSIINNGGGVGINIDEFNGTTYQLGIGYFKTTTDRNGWSFKAPNKAGVATLLNATGSFSYTLPEATGTFALLSNILTTTLTGLSTSTNSVITTSDTILSGFGKLQAQISNINNRYIEQAFTAVTSVSVVHNLNKKPIVQVIDATGNIMDFALRHVDNNNLTITFNNVQTGTVIVQG